MNYEHIQNLSDDISNLRKDTSNCDVKIKVGEGPNSKEFMAHSLILSSRSVYFKKAFSEQWARKEDEFFISNQPNISPTVFEILINHIYSGTFSVDNNEISLVDILIASDELELLEIYRQLEKRLLENESAWKLPRDFITLCKHDHLTKLYQVAIELVCKNPKFIFKSKEFLNMEEEHLIQILKRDELKLEEIEIWDYLIEWGIENTDSISNDDLTEWSPMYFKELEKTLHNCIPHIRFSQMFPKEFNELRKNYKNILPEDLVDDVLQYFSDPNSKPLLKNLPLRLTVYPFDSKIINAKDAAIIASWIDKKKEMPYRLKDIPFKFKLIYRSSWEGFNANKFHEYCDNKGPTVIIIKVRNSGEIIGGYNPLDWRSIKTVKDKKSKRVTSKPYIDHKCKTSNSFIFSLFSLTNGVIPILSRVTSKKEAIIWHENKGPCFGLHDLWIQSSSPQSRSGMSTQKSYEKKVINGEIFDIEEYEVFQIIDKRFSPLKLIKKMFNFSVKMYKKTEKTTRKKIDKKKMRREEAYRFACRFDSDLTDYLIIK
ncbi:BTB/POZ domain-containing protein [Rhizophagus irregularis DAOM 181602=DAOM 197198]|uniref:Serine-enriched protein n=2 Tax=Rhizophagus irregularis TaxID=588596 RepID=A0A015LTJ4_RHIIW|nr:hypothetical protein RirG_036930 [Rhizophagus irregularis DAOM 197198w]GBC54295.1 BTB/POZ domain-containing protein [Rhizophagus irregularis DAOM 181602=DAOM 197198]